MSAIDQGELERFLQSTPVAYAGYRVIQILRDNGTLSERGEIPLITSPLFVVAIVGYVTLRRIGGLLSRRDTLDRGVTASGVDHLFSMTSTHNYRTKAFTELARHFQESDEAVVFLCSPEAGEHLHEWEAQGIPTVTHRQLHPFVPLRRLPGFVSNAVAITRHLNALVPGDLGVRWQIVVFNYLLLEQIKRRSIAGITWEDPVIHTFSPMPYLLASTRRDRIFVYQHGIVLEGENLTEVLSFVPLTYFIWSDVFRATYEQCAHPQANIYAVGSPWFDHLASVGRERSAEKERDVLFVGGSQGIRSPADRSAYEDLVHSVVTICGEHGWELAIKLHPSERTAWYAERGWAEHVEAFEDIDGALLSSRAAVTNISSAFLESAALGTPIVVTDIWNRGVSALGLVNGVRFTDGTAGLEDALEAAVRGDPHGGPGDLGIVVKVGDSTEAIGRIVSDATG